MVVSCFVICELLRVWFGILVLRFFAFGLETVWLIALLVVLVVGCVLISSFCLVWLGWVCCLRGGYLMIFGVGFGVFGFWVSWWVGCGLPRVFGFVVHWWFCWW